LKHCERIEASPVALWAEFGQISGCLVFPFGAARFLPSPGCGTVGRKAARAAELLIFFEDFTLDGDRRELRRGTDLVPVEPKVFDLLA